MADKYKNKYRISSARLQSWDYGSNAMYFVTICTQNRQHYFGEIINDEMQLSELGKHVEKEWLKTPDIRPDMNLELDTFVVMPNHFHGIIGIGKNEYNMQRGSERRDAMHRVSTTTTNANTNATTPDNQTEYTNQFGPQSKNLASIIRGFKSSVTTYARKNNLEFEWQPRFHDHIIRDDKSYKNIVNYIITNPQNWETDKFRN
ncbi:MAG: transposase [Candidatus Aerophobetes bacterium]|nr:transposase [Candidatus Aerophobetes bacterium]